MTPHAHPTEEDLILHYYGEAADGGPVAAHLSVCDSCRVSFARLEDTLDAVSAYAVPARDEAYGRAVWDRLRPALHQPAPRSPVGQRLAEWMSGWTQPRRWAPAAAVAALVIAAFIAGRWGAPSAPTRQTSSSPVSAGTDAAASGAIRERILIVAVGDHLDRSQVILVELSNLGSGDNLDLATTRDTAEELVAANRLYRQTAVQAGDAALANVLDELERVLLEVAHTSPDNAGSELEALRQRIEAQGILFKVRVTESNLRAREQTPAAPRERQRS